MCQIYFFEEYLYANIAYICHLKHLCGLVQERLNSSANALELHLSFSNPSICDNLNYDFLFQSVNPYVVRLSILDDELALNVSSHHGMNL